MFRFFSSEIRKVKPDQEIYRHCLQLLNCTASEALFIDDREANVIAARREGITALVYRSAKQLRSELKAIGWSLLPSVNDQPISATTTQLVETEDFFHHRKTFAGPDTRHGLK
jgi:FMN phosphatase YigB (HAD superfamily)